MSLNFKSSFSLFFSEYVFLVAVYFYFMDAVSQWLFIFLRIFKNIFLMWTIFKVFI